VARRIVILLLLLFLPACGGGGKDRPYQGAVILLIDTCRYDDVGLTTALGQVTPHLDRFTRTATRFLQATAPAPWTLPSVASLLTGSYPSVHGAVGRYPDFYPLRDGVPTAPELLQEGGFQTAAFVNVPFLDPVFRLDRGFDVYDYYPSGDTDVRRAAETVEKAIRWIEERESDRPFFLLIHLFDPHMDFDPPEPHLSRFLAGYEGSMRPPFGDVERYRNRMVPWETAGFARRMYRAEIASVDEGLGRFFAWIESTGRAEELVVVVTADHGEEFWDHGNFEHGHTLYEEVVHVPLLVRAPGRSWPPEVRGRVSLIDVMPTLLELLGVEGRGAFQGRSFAPTPEGTLPGGERYRLSGAMLYGNEWVAVSGDRWKLALCLDTKREALFDLQEDPRERRDLFQADPERAARAAEPLRAWLREQTPAAPSPEGKSVNMEEEVIGKLRALGYLD